MPMFIKKPVVIEAIQIPPPCTGDNIHLHGGVAVWLSQNCGDRNWEVANENGEINIQTLEGVMHANNGDWIIRGVQGEIYPCKPDIFDKTYEPIGD